MRFRKTLFMIIMICLAIVVSSCTNSHPNEGENKPNNAIEPSNEPSTENTLTPTIAEQTPEKKYRYMIVRDYHLNKEGIYKYYDLTENEYNSSGDLIRREVYGSEGKLRSRAKYNSSGKVAREEKYDSRGNLESWTEYEYDSLGRELKHTLWSSIDSVDDQTFVYLNEYEQLDEAGRHIKESHYNPSGLVYEWYDITYDSKGNILTSKCYFGEAFAGIDMDGAVPNELAISYENEYDEFGMCTKTTIQQKGVDYLIGENNQYEYDENGNTTRKFCDPFPRKNGHVIQCRTIEEYTYDSRGNRIEEKEYIVAEEDAYMSSIDGAVIEYNYNGDVLKVKLNRWEKNEYDSYGRVMYREVHNYQSSYSSYLRDYEYVNDVTLLPNQIPTAEFVKAGEFDFPLEDQIYFEELEKTRIEPFLKGFTITRRFIETLGEKDGYRRYVVSYVCKKNDMTLTLRIDSMTRMSCDVSRVADNLLYATILLSEDSYDIGVETKARGLSVFLNHYPTDYD